VGKSRLAATAKGRRDASDPGSEIGAQRVEPEIGLQEVGNVGGSLLAGLLQKTKSSRRQAQRGSSQSCRAKHNSFSIDATNRRVSSPLQLVFPAVPQSRDSVCVAVRQHSTALWYSGMASAPGLSRHNRHPGNNDRAKHRFERAGMNSISDRTSVFFSTSGGGAGWAATCHDLNHARGSYVGSLA
jgi:hypothetical protein